MSPGDQRAAKSDPGPTLDQSKGVGCTWALTENADAWAAPHLRIGTWGGGQPPALPPAPGFRCSLECEKPWSAAGLLRRGRTWKTRAVLFKDTVSLRTSGVGPVIPHF